MQSEFLKIFKERGFLHQCTNIEGLDELLAHYKDAYTYIGFDCTGPSLHVGHLLHIMALRLLQQCGHRPIILLGGGTTYVGDPSGKDETRKILTPDIIEENKRQLKGIFAKFLDIDSTLAHSAIVVDNSEWLLNVNYIEFLRDYGKHFTINRMLGFESVKSRLYREQPLTFLEFNYMLLQAFDYIKLFEQYNCKLQLGGSDQWGNIVNGIELTRKIKQAEVFGLTTPLLTTSSGAKMGKTAQGAVWLREDYLSAYDYWQFWRNTEDGDVIRFLKLFTELPMAEIKKLEALEGKDINEAKIILANEATKLCHGEEASKEAHKTAYTTFIEGNLGDNLPVIQVSKEQIAKELPLFKVLILSQLVSSGGEAKRLIKSRGARLNDEVITDSSAILRTGHFKDGKLKLSAGKKHHAILELTA